MNRIAHHPSTSQSYSRLGVRGSASSRTHRSGRRPVVDTNLADLFGVEEPDLHHLNRRVGLLVQRLAGDEFFYDTAQSLQRASQSIPAVALIVEHMMHDCVAADRLQLDDVYVVFLLTLFVLIIDDHIDCDLDPERVTADEVEAYTHKLIAACKRPPRVTDEPLIRYISTVTDMLRAYPGYAVYESVYQQALSSMLAGMVVEYRYRGDRSDANLDEYMLHASHSTGSTLGLTGALIVLGDTSVRDRTREIRVGLEIVASIIRYSNDIRSYERELIEGNITSLQLAAKKFGISNRQIPFNRRDILRIIRAMMIVEAYDLKECLAYLKSEGGLFESVLVNAVMGVVRLYEIADFHTLALED